VLKLAKGKELKVEDHSMSWEFKDVFPEEVLGLTPKRDLDFSIDIVPRAVPTSKSPYKMSTVELVELKVQLKEMLYKRYIRSSVSPWGPPTLFVKMKDGTFRLCIEYR